MALRVRELSNVFTRREQEVHFVLGNKEGKDSRTGCAYIKCAFIERILMGRGDGF